MHKNWLLAISCYLPPGLRPFEPSKQVKITNQNETEISPKRSNFPEEKCYMQLWRSGSTQSEHRSTNSYLKMFVDPITNFKQKKQGRKGD